MIFRIRRLDGAEFKEVEDFGAMTKRLIELPTPT